MRKFLFLFLLLPFCGLSQINQTDANGLRQGLWQKKQVNGRLIYEGNFKDGKPVGEWKRFHPGGQVKALITYQNDTAFTQLFDLYRKKVAEGKYFNQKKEGLWKYFKQKQVVSDENYRGGLKHGKARRYYPSGEVMEETDWANGKQEGNYQVFYKSGEPYVQCKMKDDMRNGLFLIQAKEGTQEVVGNYKNHLRHGDWKYFNDQGEVRYTLHYNEGVLLNPQVHDSIANLNMLETEKNKDSVVDPEKFMSDPSEYMNRSKFIPQ